MGIFLKTSENNHDRLITVQRDWAHLLDFENQDYVLNVKKLCFATEFQLSVKELWKPFKTYMLVQNKLDIRGSEEIEIDLGKKSTILSIFRKRIADTKRSIRRICNASYFMHISSTGNGSGRKGNKKENPVSNDNKNKNKKGNRALRKIYPSGKFYTYIEKNFHLILQRLILIY